jgi:hypothetical protein
MDTATAARRRSARRRLAQRRSERPLPHPTVGSIVTATECVISLTVQTKRPPSHQAAQTKKPRAYGLDRGASIGALWARRIELNALPQFRRSGGARRQAARIQIVLEGAPLTARRPSTATCESWRGISERACRERLAPRNVHEPRCRPHLVLTYEARVPHEVDDEGRCGGGCSRSLFGDPGLAQALENGLKLGKIRRVVAHRRPGGAGPGNRQSRVEREPRLSL